jgi:hypothetical protein
MLKLNKTLKKLIIASRGYFQNAVLEQAGMSIKSVNMQLNPILPINVCISLNPWVDIVIAWMLKRMPCEWWEIREWRPGPTLYSIYLGFGGILIHDGIKKMPASGAPHVE